MYQTTMERIIKQVVNEITEDHNIGDDQRQAYAQRLINIATDFGIPDKNSIGFRAHLSATQTPADRSKPITLKVEMENTQDNKHALAEIEYASINIYAAQLSLKEEQDSDDDQQMDLEEAME